MLHALLGFGSPAVTFLLLATVGLDLKLEDFTRVRERPGLVAAGVLLPPLLLPGLAVALIDLLGASPAAASGLLLLVACPIGGISNTYSYLARASTALSVTLTGVSCAAAVFTIPAVALMLHVVWGRPLMYAVPLQALLLQLLVLLAPPIALGMAVRARWPAVAQRGRGILQWVGLGLLAVLLAIAFTGIAGNMWAVLEASALLATAFIVSALFVGGAIALAMGASRPDRFTFSAEFATRNVAVGMALAVSLAGHAEFALFAAVYLICEIPILMLAAAGFRRFGSGSGVA